jgi:1D-myo-inositol 3-kinase
VDDAAQLPAPAYVVVGHVARDLVPLSDNSGAPSYVPGGTALYAALTARRLGVDTGVITSAPPDVDTALLDGARVHIVPSAQATIFENRYGPGGRVQYLHGRAAPIKPGDVPIAWRAARILHLGPIADEVDPAIAALFSRALRAATPQGWARRWDEDHRVHTLPHERVAARLAGAGLDVVIFSEEDVSAGQSAGHETQEAIVDLYREIARIVVLTRGARGATIYAGNGVMHVPAYSAREVDPTGAGDVFAAAFLIRYAAAKDLLGAARFAAAAAALEVEGIGPNGIPTAEQIAARLETLL